MGVAVFSQVSPPVAQEVTPATHTFELVEQASPAVQAMQVPVPLQTSSTSGFTLQAVPAAMGVAVSTQVSKPVAQDVVPATHGFGFVAQAFPACRRCRCRCRRPRAAPGRRRRSTPFLSRIAAPVSVQISNPVSQV